MDTPIYAAFSRASGGWFSRLVGALIRSFTSGSVNHALVVYWSTDFGCWMTVGANANGVTPMPLTEFLKTRTIVYLYAPVGWSLWYAPTISTRAMTTPGCLGWPTSKSGKFGRNLLNDKSELFCSEWLTELCVTGMVPLGASAIKDFMPDRPDQIAPAFLAARMSKCAYFQTEPLSVISRVPNQFTAALIPQPRSK